MDFIKLKKLLQKENIPLDVFSYNQIDSTNVKALQMLKEGLKNQSLFVAREQTAGQGRRGRSWESDNAKGIWATLAFPENENAGHFLQAIAVAIVEVIKELGAEETFIKWPNDILSLGKKIAGLLAESAGNSVGRQGLALGFGVNINQNKNDFSDEIKTIATSLFMLTGKERELEKILADILVRFYFHISQKEDILLRKYLGYCDSMNRFCDLDGTRIYTKQINPDGSLLVLTKEGKEEIKYAGTLRYE